MADPPSPNRTRAGRLLAGGLLGGGLAALPAIAGFWIASGPAAGWTAVAAAAGVLAFFAVGQGLQVAVADASAQLVLVVALGSYLVRVGAFGVLMMAGLGGAAGVRAFDPTALVVTTIAVVVGWITGEVVAYTRLRIPVFDSTENRPPTPTAR